ncbi:NAD(P)-binding domain-containing protein [Kineococcus sp. T13]|uniref:NADPH-dependent F420 reductase n=1 Tax=Kineococcus vitellinus TaxID=2696565 RepID=UPI001411D77C|nr:NAD(P)-binding domain-containing protein [Kineococcus vitellinus]NAZ76080.1 NAD(P)-binding domain-containing protein [Kineococcus vitellinus]
MELGIIGSGNIGAAIARLATAAGIDVVLANSRGPASLTELVAELGPRASAGTTGQAAGAGEVVVLSVPLPVATSIDPDLLAGRIVLDTSNYYPFRDGRILALDRNETTTSEQVQAHLSNSRLVKVFNNVLAHHVPQLARPTGAADRSALPLAGDDAPAKAAVAALVDRLGYDTVDAGPLADSWRFEPEAGAYTRIYLADPTVPAEEVPRAPGAPLPAAALRRALAAAVRVDVAERAF